MAEQKWTPEQQDAIKARQGTLLVSAAAGSGKTAGRGGGNAGAHCQGPGGASP